MSGEPVVAGAVHGLYLPENYGPIGAGADAVAIGSATVAGPQGSAGRGVASQPYAAESTIAWGRGAVHPGASAREPGKKPRRADWRARASGERLSKDAPFSIAYDF
jgi:hypothetical protein